MEQAEQQEPDPTYFRNDLTNFYKLGLALLIRIMLHLQLIWESIAIFILSFSIHEHEILHHLFRYSIFFSIFCTVPCIGLFKISSAECSINFKRIFCQDCKIFKVHNRVIRYTYALQRDSSHQLMNASCASHIHLSLPPW